MDALDWDEEEIMTRDGQRPDALCSLVVLPADELPTLRGKLVKADELPTLRGNPIENIDWLLDPKKVEMLDVESVIDSELIFDAELISDDELILDGGLAYEPPAESIALVAEPMFDESGEFVRAQLPPQRERLSTPPESWFSGGTAAPKPDPSDAAELWSGSEAGNTLMPSELGTRPKPSPRGLRSWRNGWFGATAIAGVLALAAVGLLQLRPSLNAVTEPSVATLPGAAEPASQASSPKTRQGLALTSSHDGVDVEIDGVKRGTLPLLLDDLVPGTHRLRFSAGKRYRSVERSVDVIAGEIHDLGRIDLELAKVSLRIELKPAGASVVLRKLGTAKRQNLKGPWPQTLELEPGDYEVTAFSYGYFPASHNVRFEDKGEAKVELKLRPAPTNPEDIYDNL